MGTSRTAAGPDALVRPRVLPCHDERQGRPHPPIPPQATREQIESATGAVLKGDPDRWEVIKESMKSKVQESPPQSDDDA